MPRPKTHLSFGMFRFTCLQCGHSRTSSVLGVHSCADSPNKLVFDRGPRQGVRRIEINAFLRRSPALTAGPTSDLGRYVNFPRLLQSSQTQMTQRNRVESGNLLIAPPSGRTALSCVWYLLKRFAVRLHRPPALRRQSADPPSRTIPACRESAVWLVRLRLSRLRLSRRRTVPL